ncbi:MAG: helix-turn-helix domain-containing protein [Dysgonamonadaceae bacterium]|jgi:transcriptional regulator with XRE-family HTH domain|nr:helix-turn-helix domain-containing protein [Dysgonamonadaceae bacterium]
MEKLRLKQTRIQRGFTQQQVADALPTDISNYCRKENGYVNITKAEWKRLASFLQVPEEEIYQENEATLNNTFFDNSSITNQNIGIPTAVFEHLLSYISLLKEENERLKSEMRRS